MKVNHRSTSGKIVSAFLAVVFILSAFTFPAFAAAETQTLTETYVDDDGAKIVEPAKSTIDAKQAPAVSGYTYISQKTDTTHVYTKDHITYIVGYPDGGVKVEQSMTRAEAVTVLYRLYNGNYPNFTRRMSDNTFSDVKSTDWYYKALEMLYNTGAANGDNGKFRPNDPITRAEFAELCARYDGLKYVDKAKFSDVTLGHPSYSYINAAAEKGWIKGYPDGTFRPDNNITRAEVMALVNRLFNRPVTLDKLPANVNPYNDITENHWAYCDVIEATVKHDTAKWHGMSYNGGVLNIVIEKFVDKDGKEIAKSVTTETKQNYHPKEIKGYTYEGFITTVTYTYTNGKPIPAIIKTASKTAASVGNSVTYTVKLSNGSTATDAWRGVTLTDTIPEHMSFTHGSVYVNGVHADYSYSNRVLTVPVGIIEAGKTVTVTFDTVVASTAYGKTVTNKATGNGTNGGPVTDNDDGIAINEGEIMPYLSKSPNVTSAVVGQTVTYTLIYGKRYSLACLKVPGVHRDCHGL